MIANYDRKCKDTIGGLKRVYLMPYVKYSRSQIKSSGMTLTKFPIDIPFSTYFKFDCEGSYTQNSEDEGGAVYFNQSVNIKLTKVYDNIDIYDFINKEFRVAAETNNGKYIMFGVRNGLECTTTNSSGTDKSEFNGFDLSFKGKEEKVGLLTDLFKTIPYYIARVEADGGVVESSSCIDDKGL